jgi:NAD(P)-dependent dehydrogenase (short-subunit alcohol dehydrogenase family)
MEGLLRGGLAADEDELKERGRRSVPLGRMGTAWDVAYAALYLSSDESNFVTGLELPVDGGTLTVVGRYQAPPDAPK